MRDLVLVELQRRRGSLPIALILTLSSVLNVLGITWGLPHYVDWAIDSMALQTLQAIAKHFANGWFDKYPPVHYATVAVFYTPYIGYLLLSGGLQAPTKVFPYGLANPLSSLTNFILIARIVSVLMGVTIVLLVYVIVSELFDRRSALFSALIVALFYPLVYYAHNANAEVPYVFWALLAIYYLLRLQKDGCLKHYVFFALFGTLSICTKDQAYGLFLFSPLIILWTRFSEVTRTSSQQLRWMGILFDRRLLIAAIVAMGTFVLAHNLLFNFSGFLKHVRWLTGPGSQPYVSYAPTLTGRLQLLWETGVALAQGFTLPLFGLCMGGAVYCALKFPRYSLPLLFLAASYYLTFINVILYVWPRFVLPIGIILAFFGGKLLADIWHSGPWEKLRRGAICLAFIYGGLFPAQLDLLLMGRESRYAAEQWIQQHFRKDAIVETFAAQNVRLGWDYPRFPHWIKVRRSKLEAGTQWIPYETPPDEVRFPNLYSGREAPDYIVLSELSGRVPRDSEEEKILTALYQSRMGYALVATFKAPTIVPIRLLPVNPRIDIFERTESHFITFPSPR